MPKLNKTKAKSVNNQEAQEYAALPVGKVLAKLVEVKVKEGPKGEYWAWEFDVTNPSEFAKRKIWTNTSLAENAEWKLNEMFSAFGVPPDTDTDELVGEVICAYLTQYVIPTGKNKDKIGNQVDSVMAAAEYGDPDDDSDDIDDEEPF